jgi:hypothetical protein
LLAARGDDIDLALARELGNSSCNRVIEAEVERLKLSVEMGAFCSIASSVIV